MPEHDAVHRGWQAPPQPPLDRLKERIRWRVNRLRCMTPAEIRHRLWRALSARVEWWGLLGRAAVPPPDFGHAPQPWIHVPANESAGRYLAAAERIAAGRFDLFALRDAALGSPPRWNRDPKSGVEAPLGFGKLLDYRDARTVGDIKYVWELNRHLHFVTLAQAHALSGDARYFGVLREHLESWLDSCPCPKGPNWASALEPAIRLINWAVAWQLLGGAASALFRQSEGERFRQRWLEAVFQHARFVRGHFSLYSSANNHLIGEAAGLFIAALTWPCWPQARAWLAEAKAILEREVLLQNAADGVNLEQAVAYQRFELELLLLALLAGRANGHEFADAWRARMEAMMEYLASIMDAGGNVPMIGDSDDAEVVRLARGREACGYRSLLACGALLFRRADFTAKAGELDDKTRWLFGPGAEAAYQALDPAAARLPVRQAFPEGGYYILGCDFETGNEIRLVVDAGPLGYQSIAAHGHADALAFTLSVGGKEFLIDPGTYAYHTQDAWRGYFRGTAAHNTVRIDGLDQSEPGGNFMWLRKAAAGRSLWEPSDERDLFEGWHDGYTRLPDPVTHRRRITLDKPARRLCIEDILGARGEHQVELFFHCSERCRVTPMPAAYVLSQGSSTLILQLPQVEGAVSRLYCGSDSPAAGWVSRRFDCKEPTQTIAWSARTAGTVALRTEIACQNPRPQPGTSSSMAPSSEPSTS
ncbi:MAG: alginate lyase family protein [Burkholderiales bacterium]